MARQNGQATWVTPASNILEGDDASSTATVRIFTATERMTVVEVGAITNAIAAEGAAVAVGTLFAFTASLRTCGTPANDMVIPVFTAAFAAEGGIGGDPSVLNFDNAHQIPSGIITNTLGTATTCSVLRAYCEQTIPKGGQLVLKVTTGGAATSRVIFYAKAYYDGAGLVEPADVDSN